MRKLKIAEEDNQRLFMDGLSALGYRCLSTVHRYRRVHCPRCFHQFYNHAGYGADKAVPDLLVLKNSWPRGCGFLLEVKGSDTKVSPEQMELSMAGRIVIARTWEEVRHNIELFEMALEGIS